MVAKKRKHQRGGGGGRGTTTPSTPSSSSSTSSRTKKEEEDDGGPDSFTGEWWLDTDKASRYPLAAHRAFLRSQRQKAVQKDQARKQDEEIVRQRRTLMKMKRSFDLLDLDGSGTISKDEMKQVLLKMGLQPTSAQVDDAMKTVDTSQDGEIQFEEFFAFYKTLEARSGGFSSVFQQYMAQFKVCPTQRGRGG